MEQERIQTRLLELGVGVVALHNLAAIGDGEVELACIYTGRRRTHSCGSVVLVTSRRPEDSLYFDLLETSDALLDSGILSVTRVGDCLAPGTIAAAIYGGHRYARELNEPLPEGVPFRRELPQLADA